MYFSNPRAAGKAAHRILDWVVLPDTSTWIRTRRNTTWHKATAVEIAKLRR